jgi:hypothetical protein
LLAGRVPANTTAMIMKAAPGMEMACRAHNAAFTVDGRPVERGVVSYYMTSALPWATSVEALRSAIDSAAQIDLRDGRLNAIHMPSLQVVGDPAQLIPGEREQRAQPPAGK